MFAMVLWYECVVHLSYVITISFFYNNMFYLTYHSDFFHIDPWHSIKAWFDFEDSCSKDAKKNGPLVVILTESHKSIALT